MSSIETHVTCTFQSKIKKTKFLKKQEKTLALYSQVC